MKFPKFLGSSFWLVFWTKHRVLGVVLTIVFGTVAVIAGPALLFSEPSTLVVVAGMVWGSVVGCHLLAAVKDAIAATDYATAARYYRGERHRV